MGHNEPGERARAMTNDAPLDHAPDGARTGVFSARVAAVLVSAALFVVYTRTLCPGVLGGDAGELQFVPAILSLPHPTGTPLYVLLGHLWSRLPLGSDIAWRMNLLAAISASLAGGLLVLAVHALTARVWPGVVAAMAFGLGGTFWPLATQADKYAFNALMLALVLVVALTWGRRRSDGWLRALALVYGLSLTHHRTMLLLAPPLLGYVWWLERGALWLRGRRLIGLAALLVAPLSLYLYLPWAASRGLPPGTWHPEGLRGWLLYLADLGYVGRVATGAEGLGAQLALYARTLLADLTLAGVALGVLGLVVLLLRRRPEALLLLGAFALLAVGASRYQVPRHEVFFTPSFLIYALWIGAGLEAAAEGITRLVRRGLTPRATGVAVAGVAVLLAAAMLYPAAARYRPLRDAHHGAGTLDIWRQELKSGEMAYRVGAALARVPLEAIIVCDWEQATPLWYVQQVLGQRPDVDIYYPIERLEDALASGRPVVLARHVDPLPDTLRPGALGPLAGLYAAPQKDMPPGVATVETAFGDGIVLAGALIDSGAAVTGAVLPVTLYWMAETVPGHDWSVSVRLYGPDGSQAAQVDGAHPVLGMYPTSRWTAGEVVADYYELQIPARAAPGTYRIEVMLYRALPDGQWETQPADGGIALGTLEIRGR